MFITHETVFLTEVQAFKKHTVCEVIEGESYALKRGSSESHLMND